MASRVSTLLFVLASLSGTVAALQTSPRRALLFDIKTTSTMGSSTQFDMEDGKMERRRGGGGGGRQEFGNNNQLQAEMSYAGGKGSTSSKGSSTQTYSGGGKENSKTSTTEENREFDYADADVDDYSQDTDVVDTDTADTDTVDTDGLADTDADYMSDDDMMDYGGPSSGPSSLVG